MSATDLQILTRMNKTLLFAATVAGALGVASSAAAQPKLVKKWESEAAFKVPESVYFDKAGKVLYVSNIDGEPWGKDGAGSIGKLGLDGKVIAAEWVKGLNAPKGMALSKGKLWVADLSEVGGKPCAKGAEIVTRNPVGGGKLNESRRDTKGVLYVSDSETRRSTGSRARRCDAARHQGPERRPRARRRESTSSTAAVSTRCSRTSR